MTQEDLDWIFVNSVPMLCEKKNIERQKKIETWLDLYQLTKEVNDAITEAKRIEIKPPISYVS